MATPAVPKRMLPMLGALAMGIFIAAMPLAPSTQAAIIERFTPDQIIAPQHRDPRTINRVNTHRDDSLVVLYTNRFGRRTGIRAGGTEVIISMPETLSPGGSQPSRVLRIRRGGGNTALRSGRAVIPVKGSRGKWARQLRVGQRMDLKTTQRGVRVDDRGR